MLRPSIASHLADVLADGGWRAKARPEQLPPAGDWLVWLFLAGRGAGKTRSGAEWISESVETGEAKRIALVAPTAHDARHVMIEGESGILSIAPAWNRPDYEPSRRKLTWKNGAEAFTFSSEEADRLRGPQFDLAWADELAAWTDPQTAWDMLMFGLRLGQHPRCMVTTTPKPIRLLKDLLTRKDVVISRATTFDNAGNLAASFLEAVKARYEGTRLGRQELNAELLSDTPGSLWQLNWLDSGRVKKAPELKRIVVAVDPAVSNREGSDETGIIIAGVDHNDHGYVLADLSGRYGPRGWATKAVRAFHHYKADRIVAEKNQGGDMVETTIRMVDASVPYRAVHASRGKVTRAEPISALYEQGKVHHVGTFSTLEDQMCSFTTDFDRNRAGYSPDRLDALVWCLTELMTARRTETKTSFVKFGWY